MAFYRIRSKDVRSRRKQRRQQKCSQQRNEIESLSNELDKVRIEKQTLNKWAQDQISILKGKLEQSISSSEYDGLVVQIKSLQMSLHEKDTKAEGMAVEIQRLRECCAAAQQENESNTTGIKSVQEALQGEIDELKRALFEQAAQLQEEALVKEEAAERRIQALEEELIQAESFLKTSQGEVTARIEKELAASRLDYAQAVSDLDDRNDELEDAREDLEDERRDNDQLRLELEQLQGHYSKGTNENMDPNIGNERSFVSKLFRR